MTKIIVNNFCGSPITEINEKSFGCVNFVPPAKRGVRVAFNKLPDKIL